MSGAALAWPQVVQTNAGPVSIRPSSAGSWVDVQLGEGLLSMRVVLNSEQARALAWALREAASER